MSPSPSAAVLGTALMLFGAAAAGGQAPLITQDGDPSILNDTIYSLRVDPADHPDEVSVLLLDDGVVVLEADGTGLRTYRMVVQILHRDGVDGWAERTFGYDGDRQEFRLNWARVIGPDGQVVSEEPIHQQVMDAPVAEQSPIFTNRKRVRISLAGIEPGSLVDLSYTTITLEASRPGDFYASWLISTGGTVRRSRYIVDTPADYDLRLVQTDATPAPRIGVEGDRKVYEWYEADLPFLEPEMFPAFTESELYKYVEMGPPDSWADIGAWFADLSRDRYGLTDEILEAAARVADGEVGLTALKALHRWVAQDFRYVSISLGIGGYQPRVPEEVFRTRAGDCKDKAALFVALARSHGFEAHPVLLSSVGGVETGLPTILQFDHAIAAVRLDGQWVYLDLTEDIVPFGEVSPGYQGEFGLIVFDDGRVEEVTFPLSTADQNGTWTRIVGEIFEDGRFEGSYEEQHLGFAQYGLRDSFSQDFTPRELDLIGDRIAGNLIEGARGHDFEVTHGLDLESQASARLRITAGRSTRPNVGGGWIFTLPLHNFANPNLVAALEREKRPRALPIDVTRVSGPITQVGRLELTLPEGWRVQLPPDVSAESRFGSYHATYRQEGRTFVLERRFQGADGVAPPEALDELIGWVEGMAEDDIRFILIEPEARESGTEDR
jgi:transglutaminase-like putative cysteine protease